MDEKSLLSVFEREPRRAFALKELMHAAEVPSGKIKALKKALKTLIKDGKLEKEQDGRKYRLTRSGGTVEGKVQFESDGRAFVYPDTRGERPIQLATEDETAVKDGDRVKVALVTMGKRGTVRARVEQVLASPKSKEIGVVRRVGKAVFIEPERPKGSRAAGTPSPVLIAEDQLAGAQDGQLVEFELLHGRTSTRGPVGRVIRVLGTPGDRETEIRRILLESEISTEFPADVAAEARAFGREVDPAESARRKDLRKLPLVTIDSETARDFDDAVCVEKEGNDAFRLYVAIADVSHYVRFGRPLDREALRRGTSVYLTDRVVPMLPEELSNGLCSLEPHKDRLCLVAEMVVDREGHVSDTSFYRAVMRSHARLTYTRVSRALDGEPDAEIAPLLPSLLRLAKVAQLLLARRLVRGSIDLDLPESEVVFDEHHLPVDVRRRERNDAHRLIEDLMLAANEAVAGYFEDRELPTIFRIHEDPDPIKLEAFVQLCQRLGLGVKMKKKIRPKDVALMLEGIADHESARYLHGLLLRTLAQARYYPENEGHFGLAAERYLHFTSPIRRYPDLMVHRLLGASIDAKESGYSLQRLKEISEQSSAEERRAMVVERGSKDLNRAFVAASLIGERRTATVTSIANFGLFASLDRPFIEGMIPIQSLGGDYYEIDELGAFLRGRRTGRTFHLGMPLEVEVASVNLRRRQVELRIAAPEEEVEEGAPPARASGDGGRTPPRVDRSQNGGRRRSPPLPHPRAAVQGVVAGSTGDTNPPRSARQKRDGVPGEKSRHGKPKRR